MSKRQVYPTVKGTLCSTIDYKRLIEMCGSFSDESIEEPYCQSKKGYSSKSKVKKRDRKPRNRGN